MIILVRGGSGSGKSWLLREFIRTFQMRQSETRPLIHYDAGSCTAVLGRYDLDGPVPGKGGEACGGAELLEELLRSTAARVHPYWAILHESSKQLSHAALGRLGTPVFWATLDTPARERLKRIYQRRELSGKNVGKPLKEAFHVDHGDRLLRTAQKPPAEVVKSFMIRHDDPLASLAALITEARETVRDTLV